MKIFNFQSTYLGEVMAPILRVIPLKSSKHSQQSHREFVNVHYVPVAKVYIHQVRISIKGDNGKNILFNSGIGKIDVYC